MKVDHQLLAKYWAGACNSAEKAAVEAWLSQSVPDEYYPLKQQKMTADEMKSTLWDKIRSETKADFTAAPKPARRLSLSRSIAVLSAVAALLLLVFLVATKMDTLIGTPTVHKQQVENTYVEVKVPYGKKQKLTLGDGSVILLNSGSSLKYPKKFNDHTRTVFLCGEAFFEVSKDPSRPFIVETKATRTMVLGTRFNLLANDSMDNVLTVEEGKVQFRAKGEQDSFILTKHMQAIYAQGKVEKREVDSDSFKGWTQGQLILNDKTLKEAIPEIERWYNAKIVCTDSELLAYRVHGTFEDASLKELMHDLAYVLRIKFEIKDSTVKLFK